ncbi:MAG: helix-turn-helix transcriptional regulator [Bacteroidota bacterium]
MITLYLHEFCNKKGLKPTITLLTDMKIGYHTAKHLIYGKPKSISFDTLYKLCHNLKCKPHDIMAYTPKDNKPLPDGHPLLELLRPQAPLNPIDALSDLSPENLEKVTAMIKKMRGK